MKLQFSKYDPTGNITILVTSPVPQSRHGEIASRLMAANHIFAEQVGYVGEPSDSRATASLRMMGGEFCGNASMCLAAMAAERKGLETGCEADVLLEVSGADGPVSVGVRRERAGWRCRADMPLPVEITKLRFPCPNGGLSLPFVRFPGISFALIEHAEIGMAEAERLIPAWHGEAEGDAFGILLAEGAMPSPALRPLVRVADTGSAVWEHGCGSGTSALGACWALREQRSVEASVSQPGGAICVRAEWDGTRVSRLSIEGEVRLVCRGEAYLDGI